MTATLVPIKWSCDGDKDTIKCVQIDLGARDHLQRSVLPIPRQLSVQLIPRTRAEWLTRSLELVTDSLSPFHSLLVEIKWRRKFYYVTTTTGETFFVLFFSFFFSFFTQSMMREIVLFNLQDIDYARRRGSRWRLRGDFKEFPSGFKEEKQHHKEATLIRLKETKHWIFCNHLISITWKEHSFPSDPDNVPPPWVGAMKVPLKYPPSSIINRSEWVGNF